MIGIIGAGNMGKAIASRMRQKLLISDVDISRLHFPKNKLISIAKDNIDLVKHSEVIILAVKPQDIVGVLREISPHIKRKLIISIAAGVETRLIQWILHGARVIRVMPNMPLQVGKGISAIARGRFTNRKDLEVAHKIFLNLGEVIEVRENLMDGVTAISGSGPAYYFLFTDLLARAGESVGLNKDLATKLARATFIGSAECARESGISMQGFIKKIASKRGTTEAALRVFKYKRLYQIIAQAVESARDRAWYLSKEVCSERS